MMDTTDRTPAQMAASLSRDLLFPTDAEAVARSHQDEAAGKGKTDLAEYWGQVADIITTASGR